jgi:hypothetical protein
MSERTFEPMTKAEVIAAQREWARYVTEQDVDKLLELSGRHSTRPRRRTSLLRRR